MAAALLLIAALLVPGALSGPAAAATCGTTDLAANRPATASSTEGAGYVAANAVDGDTGTRWASAWSDPQWIRVDLGSTQSICQVVLTWEAAAGKAYQIQTSADGNSWTTVYSTNTGAGGTETLDVSGSGRYLRVYGTQRTSGYGYSLWELAVYGGSGSTPPPPDWTTIWSDNFAGTAGTSPSSANWIMDTGTSAPGGPANWGTGEVETMSNSTANVSVDGHNHLDITALRDGNGNWTSGRLETQRSDFAAPAGGMLKISAAIKQPDPAVATGYWPAFWTLGAGARGGGSWPAVGETDVMENVNGHEQTSSGLHCGIAPHGPCNEFSGRGSGLRTCTGCLTDYHTYAEIIDRSVSDEQIRWYVDDQLTWSVSESQVGVTTWQAAVDHGFFIMLDLAIGGSWPNADCGCASPNAATTSGGILSVGAVTVSQLTGPAPIPLAPPAPATGASTVHVTGGQGNWALTVNGAPYQVKGVTWGPGNDAGDGYLADAASMGVNTIRTWGTDATTRPLLDAAAARGIKVINGFWLNQGTDYVNDTTYKTNTLNDIRNWVGVYKDHPGTLMWDVGNEVLLTLQNTYSGSQLEAERNAYVSYVEQVTQAIHAIDPNHPVTSTDAWTGAWVYYKAHTPSLDLYATNAYGAVCAVKQDWINGGYTRPYIVTESGEPGEWEVPNDANGVPAEPTDVRQRDGYTSAWNCVTGHPGVSLGATLFNYGVENDFGGVWFNLLTGGWRRLSYYAVKQAYTGQSQVNTPPAISSMSVSRAGGVPAGGTFSVSVASSNPTGDTLRYGIALSSKYVDGATALQSPVFTQTGAGTFTVTAPRRLGVWKVYVYVYDTHGGVGIQSASFRVVAPPVSGTNVAAGKLTTASSYQATGNGAPFPPSNATDGDWSTRWASDWSDPQWIQVDLGASTAVHHVQLGWEAAYGRAYQIQVSPDGTSWTTVYSTSTGIGGVDDVDVSGTGRYVRLYATQRGTAYGYSLYEFGVYS
ncbi:MAG: discoidin domain-containing protein [Mycobacteriales bacterium]